jgi:hypothetical protein
MAKDKKSPKGQKIIKVTDLSPKPRGGEMVKGGKKRAV